MNREIKIRGKRQEDGIWVYGNFIEGTIGGKKFYQIEDTEFENFRTYVIDKETAGQYTGLKDKNGKEIYEGDIDSKWGVVMFGDYVSGKDDWGINYSTTGFYVKYKDGSGMAGIHNNDFDSEATSYGINASKDFEVIGNIYEDIK